MAALTPRHRRRLLIAANGLLAAALVAVIAAALQPIEAAPADGPRTHPRDPAVNSGDAGASRPLAYYAAIGGRDLRRPLFDPKPEVVVKAERPLRLQLRGTAVDPGGSYAIVRGGGGDTLMSVNDTLDEATLIAIGADSATFRFDGREITLTLNEGEGGKR